MKTEIKYSGTDKETIDKAMADTADYLNTEPAMFRIILLLGATCMRAKTADACRFTFGMIGIEGYPVDAVYAFIKEAMNTQTKDKFDEPV